MGVVRGVSAPVLVVLALALPSAPASASEIAVTPDPPTVGRAATFSVDPAPPAGTTAEWDFDGGAFEETGTSVTHTFTSATPVTVRMRVMDGEPGNGVVSREIIPNEPPTADFTFSPGAPLAGEDVSFTPTSVSDPEGGAVRLRWTFGDGSPPSPQDPLESPTHTYLVDGTYSVTLEATDDDGAVTIARHNVVVGADPGPTASFGFSPSSPLTGEAVSFTSSSTASRFPITSTDWDWNNDGQYDQSGTQVAHAFGSAGAHSVAMRVTQSNGKWQAAFDVVNVRARPSSGGGTGTGGTGGGTGGTTVGGGGTGTPVKRPVRMRPFPIVRIAGVVLPSGARIDILSVRAPRGAKVRVRCRGRGCPASKPARTSAVRVVRFHRFERVFRAGVRLEIFVRKTGRIGKYTRFTIRAGKPPARLDRCLMPGRVRPVRCP